MQKIDWLSANKTGLVRGKEKMEYGRWRKAKSEKNKRQEIHEYVKSICFVFLVSKNSLSSNEEFSSPAKKLRLFIKKSFVKKKKL